MKGETIEYKHKPMISVNEHLVVLLMKCLNPEDIRQPPLLEIIPILDV